MLNTLYIHSYFKTVQAYIISMYIYVNIYIHIIVSLLLQKLQAGKSCFAIVITLSLIGNSVRSGHHLTQEELSFKTPDCKTTGMSDLFPGIPTKQKANYPLPIDSNLFQLNRRSPLFNHERIHECGGGPLA